MRTGSQPSAQQMSSENHETEGYVALTRKTRENYDESLPSLSQPAANNDDVPEEEIKLSPRKEDIVEHFTPQVKVTPLVEAYELHNDSNIPNSTPLQPHRLNEEEKKIAKSMLTLQNFGMRANSSSKLLQRRRPNGLKLDLTNKCKFRISHTECTNLPCLLCLQRSVAHVAVV